jgi:hypothetical protein
MDESDSALTLAFSKRLSNLSAVPIDTLVAGTLLRNDAATCIPSADSFAIQRSSSRPPDRAESSPNRFKAIHVCLLFSLYGNVLGFVAD